MCISADIERSLSRSTPFWHAGHGNSPHSVKDSFHIERLIAIKTHPDYLAADGSHLTRGCALTGREADSRNPPALQAAPKCSHMSPALALRPRPLPHSTMTERRTKINVRDRKPLSTFLTAHHTPNIKYQFFYSYTICCASVRWRFAEG